MHQPDLSPVADSLGLSALVAALPLLTLFVLLGGLRMPAPRAALVSLAVALAVAVLGYGMNPGLALLSAGQGAAFGLFPIMWIVLAAIWLYQLTVVSGRFEDLRRAFGLISDDPRVQAVIIAFCFGGLLEALAGFGAPVAITGVMLIALGFSPLRAAATVLVANTAPVAFGAIATPIITAGTLTSIPYTEIGAYVGRQTPLLALIVPLLLVLIVDGRRGVRQTWPAALVCGVVFAVAQFASANYISVELTDIIAALAALAALVVFLRFWQPRGGAEAKAALLAAAEGGDGAGGPAAGGPADGNDGNDGNGSSAGPGSVPATARSGASAGPAPSGPSVTPVPSAPSPPSPPPGGPAGSGGTRTEGDPAAGTGGPGPAGTVAATSGDASTGAPSDGPSGALADASTGAPSGAPAGAGPGAPAPASGPGTLMMAFLPYLIIIAIFSVAKLWTSVKDFLAGTDVKIPWPGLDGRILDATGEVTSGTVYVFPWLSSPGSLLLIAGVAVAAVYRIGPATAVREFGATVAKLRPALLTVATVLALAYVLNFSGQTITMGTWIAGTGAAFAFLSPILGWLGTAVTGSDTSANALFATLQQTAAAKAGLDPTLLVAANTSGGVVGKMISPQNLTIAATAVGLLGKEALLFRAVLKWSAGLLLALCVLVFAQSNVLAWMPP
ncbi:L-lactate permease [Streptomyces zingiberis]|uniref:L-lactate permease n=1 Tax=Streptomyces zingiberis TaxID=2053010 RepID=A0ABX1C5P7_9ACTN|nr:L-lactate permease [Streptomyces zingiberis]NJQ03267.1 L-lactate permease [Streptomyces zingiberis]